MRELFIAWLRQTPNKTVTDFEIISKCTLAEFGRAQGHPEAWGGTRTFFVPRSEACPSGRFEVLRPDEADVLAHADQNHQTYEQVADILEARS